MLSVPELLRYRVRIQFSGIYIPPGALLPFARRSVNGGGLDSLVTPAKAGIQQDGHGVTGNWIPSQAGNDRQYTPVRWGMNDRDP